MSAPAPKSGLWVKVVVIVGVLIAVGVTLFYQFRSTATVIVVERGPAVDVVTGSVIVHADKDLQEIKSELPGRVAWIDPRQLGTPFKKGEPIVKLDSTDLERQIKQAEDTYHAVVERTKLAKQNDPAEKVAKENLAIAERKLARGEISPDDLKAVQRALDKVETDLTLADFDAKQAKIKFENDEAELQRQLDKMTIRAPMDGIVHGILVAPGALITGGTTVATYFSNDRIVIAKVGEEDIGKVKIGQLAKVRLLNQPDTLFNAKVTTTLPFADPDTQRYSVYLDVDADTAHLEPFATGEATITVGEHQNQPLVPRRAVMSGDYVFVVSNGVIHKRKVTIGFRALNLAEVTENLQPGEQVIVDDLDEFRDGEHVAVQVAK